MRTVLTKIRWWLIGGAALVLIGVGFSGQLNSYAAISYNVTSTDREFLAWNDLIGWLDFNSEGAGTCDIGQGSACVSSQGLYGYASSSFGKIYLDCESMPPDYCNKSNFKVTSNGYGALDGYAWNDVLGWFSFRSPIFPVYRVLINPRVPNSDLPPSDFKNWAWNPVVGWVSFNCADIDDFLAIDCDGPFGYKVATDWYSSSTSGWLESATFDTGSDAGAQFNSILWRGEKPGDTRVQFYFAASSNKNGPWNYGGPYPSESTSQDPDNDLFAAKLNFSLFNNNRYFRYKIVLTSDTPQTLSPTVKDVIVNWSP